MNIFSSLTKILVATVLVATLATLPAPIFAASHSDAPLIKLDPQANITDVYAFITRRSSDGVKVLNVVVQIHPFCEPGDGVIYDKFSDDARYSIHITNPTTGVEVQRYDFQFSDPSAGLKNLDTIFSYGRGTALGPILSNTDNTRNYTQTYTVTRVAGGVSTVLGTNLITPPPNVGKNITPNYNDASGRAVSGATTLAGLDNYTRDAIQSLVSRGVTYTTFAGPREDGFYADTPGIFDLLDARILDNDGVLFESVTTPLGTFTALGQDGKGVDGFKGFNVLAFAIQIPVSDLPAFAYRPVFSGVGPLANTDTTGVGVFASVSRPRITLRSATGAPTSSGPWVQVNRMGNPLFNEVLVALRDKDRYNRTLPKDDLANGFDAYALNSEVAVAINIKYGPALGGFVVQESSRDDLKAVFMPDVLRVSTSTQPTTLAGDAGFSRFSFLGGDAVAEEANPALLRSAGWPNGRRLGDDVVDIALTAVVSGEAYNPIIVVGDNVDENDHIYHRVFPYAATPHSGPENFKDRPSGPTP